MHSLKYTQPISWVSLYIRVSVKVMVKIHIDQKMHTVHNPLILHYKYLCYYLVFSESIIILNCCLFAFSIDIVFACKFACMVNIPISV